MNKTFSKFSLNDWTPVFSTIAHDTHRFHRACGETMMGWKDWPIVESSLSFVLPPSNVYLSRLMFFRSYLDDEDEKMTLELYSRNSLHTPFFPGSIQEDHLLVKRLDGSLGRFDHTLNPQYFNPNRPYLVFLPTVDPFSRELMYPEYMPAHRVFTNYRRTLDP
jgi:hypothetical protein